MTFKTKKFVIKWENQKLNHIKPTGINCLNSDLVQAYFFYVDIDG